MKKTLISSVLLITILTASNLLAQDELGLPTSFTKSIDIRQIKTNVYIKKGFQVLTGQLRTTTYGPADFVVIDHIEIPKDVKVVFAAGTNIFFEDGKRLTIEGELDAVGTLEKAVVFDILNYEKYYIKPDATKNFWKGMVLEENSIVSISDATIKNCIRGFDVPIKSNELKLKNILFKDIQDFAMRVDGEIIIPTDTLLPEFNVATYNFTKDITLAAAIEKPEKFWTPVRSSITIGSGILMLGTMIGSFIMNEKGVDKTESAAEATVARNYALSDRYQNKSEDYYKYRNVLRIVSGISAGGLAIGLVLPLKDKQ